MAILACKTCKKETVHNKCLRATKTQNCDHRCAVCNSYRNESNYTPAPKADK